MEIVIAIGLGVVVFVSGLFYLFFTNKSYKRENKEK